MMAGSSLCSLAFLLQMGALCPVDLVESIYDRIDREDMDGVFVTLTRERALAEAHAARLRLREGRSHGLLDGVPIGWKDLFDMHASVTTAGSTVLADQPKARIDADVVATLADAGMVSIGRTNMSEFAFSGLGINPHYGTPINPHSIDEPLIPGGSSSGSGVAVATGLLAVAMGSDTGGSVRIPAALTGIVGYKATRGRYSMRGVFPLAISLDSLGPLTRSVRDTVMIDAGLRGCLLALPVRRACPTRLVVPTNIVFDNCEPAVVHAFDAAIGRIADSGIPVERRPMSCFSTIFELMGRHGALASAQAFVLHRERLSSPNVVEMDRRMVARARQGERMALSDYMTLQAERERLITEFNSLLAPGELLAHPTVPQLAPPLVPLLLDDDLFNHTNALMLRNTLIGNFLDMCAISIPCGPEGSLPIGFQLAAPRNEDDRLLRVAMELEQLIRAAG
ncbi:hypothetical protein BJF92_24065 [Rhizobium rhizosphaerae]|uniref:Indoleacetamide hydrolase n=1 Tax=Xaviernesmea rhizosphaerae TaxID=1672749 RepID=A0A1Q9APY8_9HYPH|nr:amidase [Xaviernesmea rhizosphaerae]OLP57490.1 hypothetical protein BJF92_24065 [Xaviernesmea rhizosphaerae]